MDVDLANKCGGCVYAVPAKGTPKGHNTYIQCTNKQSSRANETRPRTYPCCKYYEECMDLERPNEYDPVERPEHYCSGKYECIDEMIAVFGVHNVMAFCRCNAWKYRYRADHKGGAEDLAKAEWYLTKLMELQKQEPY